MFSSIAAASTAFPLLEEGFFIHLNGLGQFVRVIVESVGMIGVGVIVFALILKAITTPFDIYQRVKMRKQNLIMKKMQPELEKLQRQYAGDKQTYSMKMMELQKKNGYSILGACLPMIISLVILIIAITAFQSYAQYANLAMYEKMAHAYNAAVLEYAAEGKDFHLPVEGQEPDELTITVEKFGEGYASPYTETTETGTVEYSVVTEGNTKYLYVRSGDPARYLSYYYTLGSVDHTKYYWVETDKAYTNNPNEEMKSAIGASIEAGLDLETACRDYFRNLGSAAAAENFREQSNPGFLWVKNVWYPDVSYNHPIQEYSSFTSAFRSGIESPNWEGEKGIADVIGEFEYNSLTADLSEEKDAANGYFGLIIISIGLMLLSQFIMMRSQKEANQYQTVDGQGARTQKVMLVVMPLMFAVFGFMWSAAFTIYNIISSVISILVTVGTNLILDRIFNKKEEEELKSRYTRTVPWRTENEPTERRRKRK